MTKKKIMVVDDSPTERAFIEKILLRGGYHVLTAASGEVAITMASSEMPDLILMDIVMPGLNGFQATRAIAKKDATRHIPIVICSTKDAETDRIWGMRQGARDYLVKPLAEHLLLMTVRALTEHGTAAV